MTKSNKFILHLKSNHFMIYQKNQFDFQNILKYHYI